MNLQACQHGVVRHAWDGLQLVARRWLLAGSAITLSKGPRRTTKHVSLMQLVVSKVPRDGETMYARKVTRF